MDVLIWSKSQAANQMSEPFDLFGGFMKYEPERPADRASPYNNKSQQFRRGYFRRRQPRALKYLIEARGEQTIMYTTKRFNKNIVDGTSYITLGDPYKGSNLKLPERWKGKGLSVPQIPQNAEKGNFSRLLYKSDPYAEMEKFAKTQPLNKRKLGFGIKDAFRRAEFTATIRTEQYRDLLRAEKTLMEKHRNVAEEQARIQKFEKTFAEQRKFPYGLKEIQYLYDVGRSQVTEFDPKKPRDRFYTLPITVEKRRGPYRTMAEDIGSGAWEHKYSSPEHGPIHHVKYFYDKSHIELPDS